ncbi:glycoside hydrolase family 44 protein [Bdellovibrio sp. HCB288]|uniref:glycoside hydrolase family 44 protein n=1 Tax=Bdellovibrio sp. HCB288 TaxID=3394355 RepID=UPI0039B6969C
MKHLITLISIVSFTAVAHANISRYTLNQNTSSVENDGSVVVDTNNKNGIFIAKSFYGADTNGFSRLPKTHLVTPLNLNYVKFGGNLHSVYNWDLNMYLESITGIQKVYSPLATRIELVQQGYKATPMFQVNMMGPQPDYNSNGHLKMMNTADETHAANAIRYLNGQKGLGVKHILMGNEPWDSQDVHGVAIPSADEYIAKYIKYAIALRDAQESISGNANDLKLWGPETAQGWANWQTTHPADCTVNYQVPGHYVCSYGAGQFSEFIPYFLNRLAAAEQDRTINPKGYKLLDYLTWHYYPLFRSQFADSESVIKDTTGRQNVAGMLESVNLWTSWDYINKYDSASPKDMAPHIVQKFQGWRDNFYPSAKIAVTEFGVDSTENVEYHPIVRPLYLADLVARVGEAGVNTFVNSFLQGARGGDAWGMINGERKTRLYHVFSLFSNNYLGQVVSSTDTYGDSVNVYSVKTNNGTNIILVNKDTVAHNPKLNVQGSKGSANLTSLVLPAWSVTVVTVPDGRGDVLVQQYGAKEMGIPVSR